MPRLIQEIYKALLGRGLTVEQFLDDSALCSYVGDYPFNSYTVFDGFDNPAAELLHQYRIKHGK